MTQIELNLMELGRHYLNKELDLTLRDKFAMAALAGLNYDDLEVMARNAYYVADAMLEARDKSSDK